MSAEDSLAWHVTQDEPHDSVEDARRLKHVAWDVPRSMVGPIPLHIRLCFDVMQDCGRQT